MTLCMIYKVFQQDMANVSMIRQGRYMDLVFVSQLFGNKSPVFLGLIVLDALANTIKNCVTALNKLPDKEANYYCGYTLMKYCAVHLGLDQIPLKYDY